MGSSQAQNYPSHGNYAVLMTADVDGRIPVVVYESRASRMKVALIDVEGPLVTGALVVATEALDDDGLPHVLEHLVLMGSEDLPANGVLDSIAKRCLSSGTAAWTEVDHTRYMLNSVCCEGICTMLPVCLDHVLYPTLTDEAFLTEIHHVNGRGDDGGVVYSEIQAMENEAESLLSRAMNDALYPVGCGYKYEFGGVLENFRDSTTNGKVRDYHKKSYGPDNLCIIIIGQVDPVEILKCLDRIEEKIMLKGPYPPCKRPWMEPVGPLPSNVVKNVPYPADEEDFGCVHVGWRGPSAVTDFESTMAVSALLDYLTDTAISPLQKEFVETEFPLASGVSADILQNAASRIIFYFNDVPLASLDAVSEKLFAVLRGFTEESFDVARMRNVLQRKILESSETLESDPHDELMYGVIGFVLYGNTEQDLRLWLNERAYLEKLKTKDAAFWFGLLREFIGEEKPHVVLTAQPSLELKAKIAAEEKTRIRVRRERLGLEGLKEKEELLKRSIDNDVDMSALMLLPIPSLENIRFLPITQYSNFALPSGDGSRWSEVNSSAPHFDLSLIPFRMRVDDVNSSFVYMNLIVDTTDLDPAARLYLPLYLESLTEVPLRYPPGVRWTGVADGPEVVVVRDGYQLVPYELVVAQIEQDTQSVSAYLGVGGGTAFRPGLFSNFAVISVLVEKRKYADGIRWLRDLLYFPHLDPVRIQVMASKLAQSVAQKKRVGDEIVGCLIADMDFVKGSNPWSMCMVRQKDVLTVLSQNLSESLSSGESTEKAVEALMAPLLVLRKFFVESTLMLYMAASLDGLHELHGGSLEKPWLEVFQFDGGVAGAGRVDSLFPDTPDSSLIRTSSGAGIELGGDSVDPRHACILGMGSVDSAYLVQTTRVSITSYGHPDYVPLLLFLEYLQQTEGPIWTGVRGLGYSYHYRLQVIPEEGRLALCISMAAQIVDAYGATERVVRGHVNGVCDLDQMMFESAKTSLIFTIVEKEHCVRDVVQRSLLSSFRGVPADFSKILIGRVWRVKREDMLEIGKKYLAALFDPAESRCAIVCHPDKLQDIASCFQHKFGRILHTFESVESSFLNEM